jgi:hypothetical protein
MTSGGEQLLQASTVIPDLEPRSVRDAHADHLKEEEAVTDMDKATIVMLVLSYVLPLTLGGNLSVPTRGTAIDQRGFQDRS